jgi:hypothetical protein
MNDIYLNILWQMMKVTPTEAMMKQGPDATLIMKKGR